MLQRSNTKLGHLDIWTWAIPSKDTCPGSTELCRKYCYSARLEAYRRDVRVRYKKNLELSLSDTFEDDMVDFIRHHKIRLIRIHTAGDFYSVEYAEKWLRIIQRSKGTRFWVYTRSYQFSEFLPTFRKMAKKKNTRLWWSADHHTVLPDKIPARVRICYLQRSKDDVPSNASLVFRPTHLRKQAAVKINNTTVCPTENGTEKAKSVSCSTCQICYMSLPEDRSSGEKSGRISLAVL